MFKNWKTSLAGLAGLMTTLSALVNGTIGYTEAAPLIALSIAAILGKDFNVTGGTIK